MPHKRIVLTDIADDIYLDDFHLQPDAHLTLGGSADWSISKQRMHGGLSDGVDVVEIDNGLLSLFVLPTRGMGIWRGRYRQTPFGWNSPVASPVHPGFVNLADRNGLGWLSGFNELICRCGLASNGPPGHDDCGNPVENPLTLHGKIANTPAHHVEIQISREGDGLLSITGVVDEAMLFGPRLRLTSRLETAAGSNRFRVVDTVTNLGGQSVESQLLYHINIGPPFLDGGAKFVAAVDEVVPRDSRAAEGIDTWTVYEPPTPGFAEQVYYIVPATDADGWTRVLLENAAADRGFSLQFRPAELPCFSLWKNTQAEADGYCTGLEPATNFPNPRTFERQQNRVRVLARGDSYQTEFDVTIHDSSESVNATREAIRAIQGDRKPIIHPRERAGFTPAGADSI